jgi:hypothetical protein
MSYRRILTMFAVAGLGALAASAALADVRDAAAKVRGNNGDATQWEMPGEVTYYRSEPAYVRTAPAATAQSPEAQRSFSYQPAQPRAAAPATRAPQATAPQATARGSQSVRAYSYEPDSGVRYYSAPRRRGSGTPTYLLPKTDPRKFDARW